MRRTSWRAVLVWALLGSALGTVLCLQNLWATEDTLGGLVAAVPGSPLDAQQRADGLTDKAAAGGHDGSQFYAIARGPFAFTELTGELDRPRYRLQRILFPSVAWALHPTGGGPALVWTMFAVLVAGTFVGALATGLLSQTLGGPPWPAAVLPALFGSVLALRICTPDAAALGLVLLSIALSLRGRSVLAVAVAVAAVLTREPTLFLLFGFAVWRRDRAGIALVAVPGAVAAAWWLALARLVGGPVGVSEFVVPLTGWKDSISFWIDNVEGPLGVTVAVLGLGLGLAALVRTRPSHPLWWPLLLSGLLLTLYSASVLAPERNASRVFLPIQVLAIVALVTPRANRSVLQRARRPATSGVPAA